MENLNNILLTDFPLEILQIIFDKLDFRNQIIFRQQCKYFYEGLRIWDLMNIDIIFLVELDDDILKKFKHIKYLDICLNNNVTNEGIKHLNLLKLNVCENDTITDDGIKNMKLHTLYAAASKISDEGIKDMNLLTLNASCNKNITDKGIKHMNLRNLRASDNEKITNDGIKHMNLYKLRAINNKKITSEGVKHMKSCKLITQHRLNFLL